MNRVTIEQVGKTLQKLSEQPEKAKSLLRYWFSFYYNIDTFSKFCFPEYIKGDIPEFHRDIYAFLEDDNDGALSAPRGHAKSTCVGLIYLSWNIVNQKEKYIVYISQNHAKTTQFVEPISFEFKNNERLRWLYGDLTPSSSRKDSGRDRQDCIDVNGCRVEAVSFEKNLRGFKYNNMRPTLIIGDDIEDDSRVTNPVLRDKDEKKLNNIIIPSLDINGKFKMVGTILHLDSLLMKKIKLYQGKIFRAEDEDGNILWEQRFTREKLEKIKQSIGSVSYQQEYLNNPVDNSTSTIKREWIENCLDPQFPYSYEDMDELYLGVDFAFSDRISADSSAFIDIGIKKDRYGGIRKYILNMVWKRGLSILEQFDYIRYLHQMNGYNIIALEENSIKSVSAEVKNLGLPVKMLWTGSRDVKPSSNTSSTSRSYSKENAVERLAVEFENQMWTIPYNNKVQRDNADRLIAELTSWSKEDGKLIESGAHPDMPIGMLLINEIFNKPKYGYVA